MQCYHCGGTGSRRKKGEKKPGHPCDVCKGKGEIPNEELRLHLADPFDLTELDLSAPAVLPAPDLKLDLPAAPTPAPELWLDLSKLGNE